MSDDAKGSADDLKGCLGPFLNIGVKKAARRQEENAGFFRVAANEGSQVGVANMFLEIKQSTESPEIGLPFLATFSIEEKPHMSPRFGGELCNDINFPITI